MSRESVLLAVLTSVPTSTSELYERVGYATLTRVGLVPYDAFRRELSRLAAAGQVLGESAPDGSTAWRLTPATTDPQASGPATPDQRMEN
jgi:hypothetical protein